MRIGKKKTRRDHRKKTDPFYTSSLWKILRETRIKMDHFSCVVCDKLLELHTPNIKRRAFVDHIIPRKQGGSDELDNLQTLCKECHDRKSAKEVRR